MLGYEDQAFEMNFETWKNLCHPEDFQPTVDKINSILKTQSQNGYVAEFRMKNKSGQYVWVQGRGNVVVRDQNGDPLLLSGTNSDISERIKWEKEILKEKLFNEKLLDSLPVIFYLYDKDNKLRKWNKKFAEELGFSDPELQAMPLDKLLAGQEVKDNVFSKVQHVFETNTLTSTEAPLRTKVGKEISYFLTGVRFESDQGDMLMGVGINISEKKSMENALTESERKYKEIFNATSDAIFIHDGESGAILDVNETMLKMYAFERKEEVTNSFYNSLNSNEPGYTASDAYTRLSQIKLGKTETFDWIAKKKNGENFWVEVSLKRTTIAGQERIIAMVRDISSRKEAELKSKENKRFIELITEQSPDIIYVYDIANNKNIFINKNLRAVLDYKYGEVPEDSMQLIDMVIHPDDLNQFYEYEDLIHNWEVEYVHQFEYRLKDANGNWRWFLGREKEFQRTEKNIVSLIGVVSEITKQKKAEMELIHSRKKALENEKLVKEQNEEYKSLNEELLELNKEYLIAKELAEASEWRFKILYEISTEGLMIHKHGTILDVNQAFVNLLGYENENELIGKNGFEIVQFTPESKNTVVKNINSNFDKAYDIEIMHKNGSIIPVETRGTEINYKENKARLVYMRDISERIKAEKSLKESEEKYRFLTENILDVIWIIEIESMKFKYISPSVTKLLGFTVKEIKSQAMEQLLTKHSNENLHYAVQSRIERFKKNPITEYFIDEAEQNCKDGSTIWTESVTYFRKNSDNKIEIIGTSRNISDRKKIQLELENYRNHLEKLVSQRTQELNGEIEVRKNTETNLILARDEAQHANSAKSEFLSSMSHELRTPLNAILGFSKILGMQKNITENQKEQLLSIYNCGEHLLSLINDILDMSKIEAQKLELTCGEFNLAQVVHTVFNINKIKAEEKDLEFKLILNASLPKVVFGDERKIKQIMLNLISNAIKFTDEGVVSVKIDYDYKQNILSFHVEDTGIGIPEHKQKDIFEPFIQYAGEKLFHEGTGLGLTITHKLIEMMHGEISLSSKPNVGSIFTVEIPIEIITNDQKKISDQDFVYRGYLGERRKILIVDDNQSNVSLLASLLKPVGFMIETAENGKVAFKKLTDFFPDLIILDYRMPLMNGLEFGQILRQNNDFNQMIILGISASIQQKEKLSDFKAICNSFLAKPIDINQFYSELKELLKIEWIKDELNYSSNKSDEIITHIPSKKILLQLLEDCESGYYNALAEKIELLQNEETYSQFCNFIKKYMKQYDFESIIVFLNQHILQ